MKLLFDQNVSPWLCGALSDVFPNSIHVRNIGLREADDAIIWVPRKRAVYIEEFFADEQKSFVALLDTKRSV